IALQSGVWHKLEREVARAEESVPTYEPKLLRATLKNVVRARSMWEAFFSRYQISPLRITYEEFASRSDELASTSRRLLRFLGYDIPGDYAVPSPATRKIGRQLNCEWAERLRTETKCDPEMWSLIE